MIFSVLFARWQELMDHLSEQKATLKRIADGLQSRYLDIPADISKRVREVQLSVQREEEKVAGKISPRSDSHHPSNVAQQSTGAFLSS